MKEGAHSRAVGYPCSMKLSLDRNRIDALPREVVLDELRKVALHYSGRRFSRREFDLASTKCKGTTVLKHFGTWDRALATLGMELRSYKPDRTQIQTADLLRELARIWRTIRHRPSKAEWEASDAIYSYTTYKQRFGGWVNACAALIESEGYSIDNTSSITPQESQTALPAPVMSLVTPDRNRTIPLKLRLKVFTRDGFKCCLCGRTPALDSGVVLHVDHILPFSKGGASILSNLQTLCDQCNLGKGNELA